MGDISTRAAPCSVRLEGWLADEEGEKVRERAAKAYDKYQACGINSARSLFATGW